MAARRTHPLARLFGLAVLVAAAVGIGFALGMARPQQVLVTAPAADGAPSPAERRGS